MDLPRDDRLKVFVLGQMRLEMYDRARPMPYTQVRRLLAYLAVERRGVARESLGRLLWPGKPMDLALGNLRQALHQLRKVLDVCADQLMVSRSEVALEVSERLWIDVGELARCVNSDSPAAALRAIEICTGQFLEDENDPGERWIVWKRAWADRVENWLDTAYSCVIADLSAQGAWEKAMHWSNAWRNRRPLADEPCLMLMRLMVKDGRKTEAQSLYRLHCQTLAEQAGRRPGRALESAREALLGRAPTPALVAPIPAGQVFPAGDKSPASCLTMVTVLTIALNLPRPQVTLLALEQHLRLCLGHARDLAEDRRARLRINADGSLEIRFGEHSGCEDGPMRALRAGLEFRRRLQPGMNTGIGIHCGQMLVDQQQDFSIGTVSQEARALAWGNTSGTGVLISRTAWHLLSPAEPPSSEQSRNIVEVYGRRISFYWVNAMPVAAGGPRATKLVGRQEELGSLCTAIEGLRKNAAGKVVWLIGEAGIGKSCLLQAACEYASDRVPVFIYRCSSEHQESILFPVAEMIRNAFGLRGEHPQQAARRLRFCLYQLDVTDPDVIRIWSLWLGLELGSSSRMVSPEIGLEVLYESLFDVLPRQFSNNARMVVIEDVHWADSSTLELLRRFLQRIEHLPVLALITSRRSMPLLRDIARRREEFALAPLPDHDAAEMIRQIQPGQDVEMEAFVLRKARGNPLFIESILRFLDGTQGGTWVSEHALQVPDELHLLLGARVSQAGEFLDVLQAGAVLGESFEIAALQSVAILDEARLQQALAHLVGSGLLRFDSQDLCIFPHVLLRDTVYAGIPLHRRRQLHEIAAYHLLASADNDAAELAWHWTQGGKAAEAAACWLQAARQAHRLAAKRQALHLYQQAHAQLLQAAGVTPQSWELEALHGIYLNQRALLGYSAPPTAAALEALATVCELYQDDGPYRLCVLHGRWAMASVLVNTGHALGYAQALAQASLSQFDPATHRGLAEFVLGWCHCWRGELSAARQHFLQSVQDWDEHRAQESVRAIGQRYGENALAYLAILDVIQGCPRPAVERDLLQARMTAQFWPDALAFLLSMETSIQYWWRDLDGATRVASELNTLSTRWNLGLWSIFASAVDAWSRAKSLPQDAASLRDLSQAMEKIEQSWGFGAGFVALTYADALIGCQEDAGPVLARGLRHLRSMDIKMLMPEWQYLAGCHYQNQGWVVWAHRRFLRALQLGMDYSPISAARAALALARMHGKNTPIVDELGIFLASLQRSPAKDDARHAGRDLGQMLQLFMAEYPAFNQSPCGEGLDGGLALSC